MASSSRILPEIDPAQLITILIDLQISIRKVTLYGFSHPIVPGMMTKLTEQLNAMIQHVGPLSFGITKNNILYNGSPLSHSHPVIGELAKILHQLDLIQLTFKKTLLEEDMLALLKFVVETRSVRITQEDPLLKQFHNTVDSISLQRVSFKEALSLNDEKTQEKQNVSGSELWNNLVNQLKTGHLPEPVLQILEDETDALPNPEQIAGIINTLYAENKNSHPGDNHYDTAVVSYLHERARQELQKDGPRTGAQTLGALFSSLREDVRDQLFRFATQEKGEAKLAMESFLDILPPKQLPEVLKQIQLSEQNVSKPMFSLLKKMVTLSGPDDLKKHLLSSRGPNHEALIEELLSDRSDREYYPAQHRTLLDTTLSDQMTAVNQTSNAGASALDPSETDYHLALILGELIDGPIYAEAQMEGCVLYMKTLLIQGLGENTQVVLINTIETLLKNCRTENASDRTFWQKALKTILVPEIVVQLLNPSTDKIKKDFEMGDLITITGTTLFPVLLEILENESNLSTRKYILQFIVQCGPPVIPLVVEHLTSDKWYVVRNMLMILKDLNAREALSGIARCITHESEKVRQMALQALATTAPDSDESIDAAKIGLQDEDEKVSKTAAYLIAKSANPNTNRLVTNLLQYQKKEPRFGIWQKNLITEIGKSGFSGWLPILRALRKSPFQILFCWGRERQLQNALRDAILKLEKEGGANAG